MRIHRISLRNYRGIAERDITLADNGVTIVEGANELGKTSTVEALDLLLEELDSSSKRAVKAVQPTNRDVGTDVEAEFSTGQYRFVYRKRWNRQHETLLRIIEPAPEQLTGRQAHDRVQEILDETLDRALWTALRVEQRRPVDQASLGGNDRLAQALDAASGGARETGHESSLYERVEEIYREFFTPTGKATGEYRAADERRSRADAARENAVAKVQEVERDVARHSDLCDELLQLKSKQARHGQQLDALEEQWSNLETTTECEALGAKADIVRKAAQSASEALDRRKEAAAAVDAKKHDIAKLQSEVAQQDPASSAAERYAAAAKTEHDDNRKLGDEAERLLRSTSDDVAHLRDRADVSDLIDRRKRLAEARQRVDDATAFIAACQVDDGLLRDLEQVHIDAIQARATLQAASSRVVIDAMATGEIQVGEQRTAIAPHATLTRSITEATEINFPGLLRLRIVPGAAERHPYEAKQEADNALRTLCERAGVADIAAAREMNQRLNYAERESAEAHEAARQALSDLTAEELEERFTTLNVRIQTYAQQRAAEPALPPDLNSAVAAEHAARERLETIQAQMATCAELLEQRRQTATKLRETALVRDATIDATRTEQTRLQQQLDEARARVDDQRLETDTRYAEEQATLVERELKHHEEALAALDPDILNISLSNARQVRERMIDEERKYNHELTLLTGKLEAVGSEGRQDQMDAAESTAEAAESAYCALRLRALAAQLLHDTMTERREEAKRSYVAPFRSQLEKLGRIVFGPSLRLDVDGDLRIVSRTVDNVTVRYDDLSTGAQEQLCLIGRLACANLVNQTDGVPVIIDDALGHSDPRRLERLGAVFAASAASSQIIVLTCVPERFRGIGSAHVIQLTSSPHPLSPEPNEPATTAPIADGRVRAGTVDLSGAVQAVIDCLRVADRPLGKAEILSSTGLPAEAWPQAIRILVDECRVVREGERRGATYALAS